MPGCCASGSWRPMRSRRLASIRGSDMTDTMRAALLQRLQDEREALIGFLQDFLRARSANPPGDTTEAADCIGAFLNRQDAPWRIAAAKPHLPNIVGSFEGGRPGRH